LEKSAVGAREVFGKLLRAIWWKKGRFFDVKKPVFLCRFSGVGQGRK
jgi:hypothetical protein